MSIDETVSTPDSTIVRAAIHPAIGVARVGNSPEGYYIGPEVTGPQVRPPDGYRDATGAIKRQVAQFRVYGYNVAGEVVAELTSDNAAVSWTVHLANTKAAWYRFDRAMDIPEAAGTASKRRNQKIAGDARKTLEIDPGPGTVEGDEASPVPLVGSFEGTSVYLGELCTDHCGRLQVFGGRGVSASPSNLPIYQPNDPATFNNADGWHDDTSDGPVIAAVTVLGRDIPVDPAWVIVAPPDFAPNSVSWRTMHDLMSDLAIESGRVPFPSVISFTNHILPVVQRLSDLQWVNAGFAAMFEQGSPINFDDPALLARLATTDPANEELRRTIFNSFRPADPQTSDLRPWPWIYGDAYGTSAPDSPRNNLALSAIRARMMQVWVYGHHVDDYVPGPTPGKSFDDVPLLEQPTMLDEASMTYCLADAFHPGCELTWPMRHASLYSAPHRVRHRERPEPDYGIQLTQAIALDPDGPLYGQSPGSLTRWMALPWQADTAFCRSGYAIDYDPYLPTFWPARVPNQVLTEASYKTITAAGTQRNQQLEAFRTRAQWLRTLDGLSAPDAMVHMVEHFADQGIVEKLPGIADDPELPASMFVEIRPQDVAEPMLAAVTTEAIAPAHEVRNRRLRQAGWTNEAQLADFLAVRNREPR